MQTLIMPMCPTERLDATRYQLKPVHFPGESTQIARAGCVVHASTSGGARRQPPDMYLLLFYANHTSFFHASVPVPAPVLSRSLIQRRTCPSLPGQKFSLSGTEWVPASHRTRLTIHREVRSSDRVSGGLDLKTSLLRLIGCINCPCTDTYPLTFRQVGWWAVPPKRRRCRVTNPMQASCRRAAYSGVVGVGQPHVLTTLRLSSSSNAGVRGGQWRHWTAGGFFHALG